MAYRRRGLGKGMGKGYRNIIIRDPKIHANSAKGIKQPQYIRNGMLRTIRAPPLKSANRLPVQIGIIVPSKRGDKPIGEAELNKMIDKEKEWFSRRFGGDTSVESVGSYWDGKKLIKEEGRIVWSSTSLKKYNRYRSIFARHAERRRNEWGQDTVLVKVEGQDFITPYRKYIDDDVGQSEKIIVT